MAQLLCCSSSVSFEFPNHNTGLNEPDGFGIGLAQSIFACSLIAFALKIKRSRESVGITRSSAEKDMATIAIFPFFCVHGKNKSRKLKWPMLLNNRRMEVPGVLLRLMLSRTQPPAGNDLLDGPVVIRKNQLSTPLPCDFERAIAAGTKRSKLDHAILLSFMRAMLACCHKGERDKSMTSKARPAHE